MSRNELVLVLHGLGNSRTIMSGISWYLKRKGYDVLNVGYPSCSFGSAELATQIAKHLHEQHKKTHYKSVSIVGFSLGSQLARIIIEENFNQINFSRLVMIGPPNQGSSIARFLKKRIPTSKIWGPIFDELCQSQLPNPTSRVEVGIIAGALGSRIGINPFFGEDNDGLVTVKETFLEGAKSHKKIFAPHGTMPLQPRVMRLVVKFLESGSF